VPRFSELSVKALLTDIANDKELQMYLPDLKDSEGHIKVGLNKQYLFNVINTIRPEFFSKNISALYAAKKEEHAERTQAFINIDSRIYDVIAKSTLINKSKLPFIQLSPFRLKR
jgi:hypothetical protein